MIHTAYTLHPGFVKELSKRIHLLIESTAANTIVGSIFQDIPLIPSQQFITQIVDAAVWTSFATDEGNPVTISITLSPPAEDSFHTFIFDRPISFDVNHLVKLGAALENPRADISVWPDEKKQLAVWGFRTRSVDTLLPTLCVEAMAPGNVLITFGGKSLAALSGNEAFFTDHSSLMSTIIPKLSSPIDKQSDGILYLMRYMSLLNTARNMRAHGRGGTLLVVPENSDWQRSIDTPVPYTGGAIFLESDYDVTKKPSLITNVKNFFGTSSQKSIAERDNLERLGRQLGQQCKHIARLTAVDGALVMSFDRFVYCFGAKIIRDQNTTPPTNIRVYKPVEGDNGTMVNLMDLGGTRHQSAAHFANAQPGAVAIVVSQDGHVSIISSDPETKDLIVIQHAELAVIPEGMGAALWSYSLFTEMDLL